MKIEDRKAFAAIIATLSEVFDQVKEISKLKMDVYFKALEEFTIDQISQAASNLIRERVFPSFPKPAEIIIEIRGKCENRAIEAWLKTMATVKRIGNYQSVQFDDPVIHSTVEAMGGWQQFCSMLTEEEKWKVREFERLYVVISARQSANHPKYLPGTHEIINGAYGREIEPPVFIGEQDKTIEAPHR